MERIAESESPERYKRREEEGERTLANRGRKLNNQTFPQGFRGVTLEANARQSNGNGGEVTGKNQKNKR